MQGDEIEDGVEILTENDERLIRDTLGLINLDHYYRYRMNVSKGLIMFGNSFEAALGNLLLLSNFKNTIKILNVWQNRCSQADMIWRMHEAKEKAHEQV
jgi:hypothetical protein